MRLLLLIRKKKRFGFLQKLFFIDLEGREREIPVNVPGKAKDGRGFMSLPPCRPGIKVKVQAPG